MRDYENLTLDLRERASSYEQMFGVGESSIVMKDAADAIEELVAQRDKALKRLCEWCGVCSEANQKALECDDIAMLDYVPKTAFWVDTQPHMDDSDYKKDGMSYYCSNCHHRAGKYKHRTYKFCPWCGAKIIKKGENADDQQYQLHG